MKLTSHDLRKFCLDSSTLQDLVEYPCQLGGKTGEVTQEHDLCLISFDVSATG